VDRITFCSTHSNLSGPIAARASAVCSGVTKYGMRAIGSGRRQLEHLRAERSEEPDEGLGRWHGHVRRGVHRLDVARICVSGLE
jgi:hypothetical protein